ncbi:hypothetical protein [Azospirillum sp. sgz302134]
MARDLDESAIRAQLDRILSSDAFDASERNRRFLRYVVEESLAGRSQQIKAYCIAVSVFNRESSFDPQSDPIVRLEAGRLRRSLEHYYLTAGCNDSIRIVVPKGGYAPRFEAVESPEPMPTSAPPPTPAMGAPRSRVLHRPMLAAGVAALVVLGAGGLLTGLSASTGGMEEALALAPVPHTVPQRQSVAIVVAPFRTIGGGEATALAAVLTDEIVRGLTAQTDLPVILEPSQDEKANGTPKGQDLRLSGSLQVRDGEVRALVHLTDRATGTVLWSEPFDRPPPQSSSQRDPNAPRDLAAAILTPLADPQGPLAQSVSARLHAHPVAGLAPRDCAVLATDRREHPPAERKALRACLERGTTDKTLSTGQQARLWAALSLLHADEHRQRSADRDTNALDQALAAALRATELAPTALRPLTALYTAYCLRRQYEPCFAAGDKALKAAPEDPKMLADLGLWHVEAGDAERGMALMERAMERDPTQAPRLLPAYGLARQRGPVEGGGTAEAKLRLDITSAAPAQAAQAVAFVQAGRIDDARAAATKALAADPNFPERAAREQRSLPLPPELDATIRSSFAAAGLTAPDPLAR